MSARIRFIRERNFTKVIIDRPLDAPATAAQLAALHSLTIGEWVAFAHPRNGTRPTLGFINSPTLTQLWTTRDRERHVRKEIDRIHNRPERRSRGRKQSK
ncbi:MAG: hypothetical protein ACQEW8_10735 [Actinomycetota bacterium]